MELDRCRDLEEHLPAFVTGDLEPNLSLRVQKHLGEACPRCALEIQRLHEAFQRLPLTEAPCPLPQGSIDVLVEKIAAEPQDQREQPIVFRETNEGKLAWTLVVLAMAALISVGFWGRSMEAQLSGARASKQAAERQTRQVVEKYRSLDSRAREIAAELETLKAEKRVMPDKSEEHSSED